MVIYLDSAAIVKLVQRETECDALDLWLAERLGQPRVTSALAEVEVPRAILRTAPASQPRGSDDRQPGNVTGWTGCLRPFESLPR